MATISAKQRAKLAQERVTRRRSSTFKIGIAAVAALALVVGLIALQITGEGGGAVEPPIGEGRTLGDAAAPVTIVEYADFQCPVCKRAATDLLPQIETDYVSKGLVRVEYRHFPFLGQESWDAAQAAAAAEEQGKFWEFYAALYNAQGRENGGSFSYDRLLGLAEDVGLDVGRFDETLGSNASLDSIQAEYDAARERGVSSTPTFFVGDTKIVGVQEYQKFVDAIEHELAAADAEVQE